MAEATKKRLQDKDCRAEDVGGDEEEQEEEASFEEIGLDPRLIRALSKKNIKKPTPIQRVSIPLILVNPFISNFFSSLCL